MPNHLAKLMRRPYTVVIVDKANTPDRHHFSPVRRCDIDTAKPDVYRSFKVQIYYMIACGIHKTYCAGDVQPCAISLCVAAKPYFIEQ